MNKIGIYIHLPFCVQKCFYCDFNSYENKSEKMKEYLSALLIEIGSYQDDRKIQTIFLGGGTPSYYDPVEIDRILSSLKNQFDCREIIEITLESNPETIDSADKLIEYRQIGINRISLGAQSFNDWILEFMNRPHNAAKIIETVHNIRNAGIDNLNLDLIFGYPQQSINIWKDSLEQAIQLEPEHISLYELSIEPGTILFHKIKNNIYPAVSEETILEMYHYAIARLKKAGYIHYEISNFAMPNRECRHNINYWENGEYYGFGAGAHSHINNQRYWNIWSLDEYIRRMQSDKMVVVGQEKLTQNQQLVESIMLSLRLRKGINRMEFMNRFHNDPMIQYQNRLRPYIQQGFIELDENYIRLTDAGLDISDTIIADLVR